MVNKWFSACVVTQRLNNGCEDRRRLPRTRSSWRKCFNCSCGLYILHDFNIRGFSAQARYESAPSKNFFTCNNNNINFSKTVRQTYSNDTYYHCGIFEGCICQYACVWYLCTVQLWLGCSLDWHQYETRISFEIYKWRIQDYGELKDSLVIRLWRDRTVRVYPARFPSCRARKKWIYVS